MTSIYSTCVACGVLLTDPSRGMCAHHAVGELNWAAGNKVWCDWIHRGLAPTRLAANDRADFIWPPVTPGADDA